MEEHIKKYFSLISEDTVGGKFAEVLVLHETPDVTWDVISAAVPNLPRGWYELAQLEAEDRVDFTRDFWLSKLPFHPNLLSSITKFFDYVQDVGVVIAQRKKRGIQRAHMIYALKNGAGFFHGGAGMTPDEKEQLQALFPDVILPEDYLVFLEIHNGFSKTTDTGVICTRKMQETFDRFQSMIYDENPPMTTAGESVNPHSLIPFYESFGMPFFQCFWSDWYPQQEMGNVYFSGVNQTILDVAGSSVDTMAFPTFLDWLFFYLYQVQ